MLPTFIKFDWLFQTSSVQTFQPIILIIEGLFSDVHQIIVLYHKIFVFSYAFFQQIKVYISALYFYTVI